MRTPEFTNEFARQVDSLLEKGYPKLAGMSEEEFLKFVEPLKIKLEGLVLSNIDFKKGILPFVIVVKSDLIPAQKMMSVVERENKTGITKLYPHGPKDFQTINSVIIPDKQAYLLIEIDRGKEFLNVKPSDALMVITQSGRSPLTIDEGIAVVTHYPDFLMKNNCFSLLASRHPGNQRVPAIWINAEKKPHLGWCWDGNPHSWLGSASCKSRLGA